MFMVAMVRYQYCLLKDIVINTQPGAFNLIELNERRRRGCKSVNAGLKVLYPVPEPVHYKPNMLINMHMHMRTCMHICTHAACCIHMSMTITMSLPVMSRCPCTCACGQTGNSNANIKTTQSHEGPLRALAPAGEGLHVAHSIGVRARSTIK